MRLWGSGLVLALATITVAGAWAGSTRRAAQRGEQPPKQEDPARTIAQIVREVQMDLEGSSSTGVLSKIDRAKFEDYPRFQDMVERLTREDTLRVFFRQTTNSVKEDTAQTILDAEMEMTRKDSAVPTQRRKQQITIDLARTSRGWKITNITPRDFFQPL